ncbi:hypothetical protein MUTS16_49270 [Escherichia coli]|nr:hypothetical protein MUTS16_49270 [Escherichia coli]
MSGSLLGPLLFFILFNLVRLATRYYGVAYGYSKVSISLKIWVVASCKN